jgi:F-type H+-transporting ATPase subunit delta
MSKKQTLARPYAKAIFEYALQHETLNVWLQILASCSQLLADVRVQKYLSNPTITKQNQMNFIFSIINEEKNDAFNNFIALLSQKKRLILLPEIYEQYKAYQAEYEKTVAVTIVTFMPLSAMQQEKLTKALTQKLKRKVAAQYQQDINILGGVVVYAGDLVVDASALRKLQRLTNALVA